MLGTVAKAGKVLDLFTEGRHEWGVREVADQLDIPKSSAHALLSTLTEIGLTRRSNSGRYRLGWRIIELNRALVEATGSLTSARPVLRQLASQLGATMQLAALRQHAVAVLDAVEGEAGGHLEPGVQAVAPHGSAVGRVLLAQLEPTAIEEYLTSRRLRYGDPDIHVVETRLWSDLEAIRTRGYVTDVGQSHLGVGSIAVPVHDASGACHTAIGLSVRELDFRRNREILLRSVQRAAAFVAKNAVMVDQRASDRLRPRTAPSCRGLSIKTAGDQSLQGFRFAAEPSCS
jgi:IclR family KDG regulon transcriptional repressor